MTVMTPIPHADLLAEIEAFCERRNVKRSRFGQEAMGDPRFVFDLAAGRQCLPKTVAKARDWIAQQDRGAA